MSGKDRDEKRTETIKAVLGSKSSSDNTDCPLSSQTELDGLRKFLENLCKSIDGLHVLNNANWMQSLFTCLHSTD